MASDTAMASSCHKLNAFCCLQFWSLNHKRRVALLADACWHLLHRCRLRDHETAVHRHMSDHLTFAYTARNILKDGATQLCLLVSLITYIKLSPGYTYRSYRWFPTQNPTEMDDLGGTPMLGNIDIGWQLFVVAKNGGHAFVLSRINCNMLLSCWKLYIWNITSP